MISGAISIPAGTVTDIVTLVSGLDSVNNLAEGTIGRNRETDEELRIRRRSNLGGLGKGTEEAIRHNIMQYVPNVTAVTLFSNRTDAVDSSGRLPHSFETIVAGGTDDDVAKMIWDCMPAGIQPVGNKTVVIQDSTGRNQTIQFSRPSNIYIWLQISLTLYSEEKFPVDGVQQVKNNIIAYSLSEYQAGVDVIFQRLLSPVYAVPGIGSADILTGKSDSLSTPPASYSRSNIAIASNEIAVFNANIIAISNP